MKVRLRIAIADDDEISREFLFRVLSRMPAGSGPAGWRSKASPSICTATQCRRFSARKVATIRSSPP